MRAAPPQIEDDTGPNVFYRPRHGIPKPVRRRRRLYALARRRSQMDGLKIDETNSK